MFRHCACGIPRFGGFCIDRELCCRIFVTLIGRVFVIRVFGLVDFRHIPGIVHCGYGKILISRIKLLQADIQRAIRKLFKFIPVHIDRLCAGIRIMYLNA